MQLSLRRRKGENSAHCYKWGNEGRMRVVTCPKTNSQGRSLFLPTSMLKLLVSSPRLSKPKHNKVRWWAQWITRVLRNAPVYCMDGRRWGTGQPCAGVVVPNRLDDTGDNSAEHANDTSRRDGGQAPLNCGKKTNVRSSLSQRGRQTLSHTKSFSSPKDATRPTQNLKLTVETWCLKNLLVHHQWLDAWEGLLNQMKMPITRLGLLYVLI